MAAQRGYTHQPDSRGCPVSCPQELAENTVWMLGYPKVSLIYPPVQQFLEL